MLPENGLLEEAGHPARRKHIKSDSKSPTLWLRGEFDKTPEM